ncbi:MAG: hypothetical protein RLZZ617_1127, partial [Bacteroidota bacterium]
MKKTLPIRILMSLTLLTTVLASQQMYAQNTGVINTNLNVGATVLAQLKLTNNSDVQFGNLSAT